MGFSFSGLSPVTSAGAGLDTDSDVYQDIEAGLGRASLIHSKATAGPKDPPSDFESDSDFVLCACADAPPSQTKDVPAQASSFSAVWNSAFATLGLEPSADAGSPSILQPADKAYTERASQPQRADALAAIRWRAGAAADPSALATLSFVNGEAPAGRWNVGIGSADIPPQAAPLELLAKSSAIDITSGRYGTTGEVTPLTRAWSPSNLAAASVQGNGHPASHDAALPEVARRLRALDATADPTKNLSASAIEAAARDFSTSQSEPRLGEEVSFEQNKQIVEEQPQASLNPPVATDQVAGQMTVELHAPRPTPVRVAPTDTAAAPSTEPGTPGSTGPAALKHQAASSADVPLPGHLEGKTTQASSEIAFQAELTLREKNSVSNRAQTNRQTNPDRMSGPGIRGLDPTRFYGEPRQRPEASTEGLQINPREALRSDADLKGDRESFLGSDQQTGSLDRGAQQTAPLPQTAAGSQAVSPASPSAKQPAVPAAAQLDGQSQEPVAESAQPARSVAFKIQGDDRGTANVVLTDRGGQVHVTVRSNDPALAQTLRGDLGSLAGGLQQSGFDVKVWNPSSGSSSSEDSRADARELSHEDAQGNTRQRHSPDDAQQRDRRGAEWPEEID